ncbi:unnamed protein product [marine sediment metagenome]|uniref:Dephospho-CoA kinase n=1 Tax=marine sediment metagenome TaxID=412755 RepID=X1M1R9_9ZZZZ
MLGVDAPVEVRFKRAMVRGRTENATTLKEFIEMEAREKTTDKNKQQLTVCLSIADKVITNPGSFEDLHRKVDKILETLP